MKIKNDRKMVVEEMKKIAAEIGMMEIKRKTGIYVPLIEINRKKKQFALLHNALKGIDYINRISTVDNG